MHSGWGFDRTSELARAKCHFPITRCLFHFKHRQDSFARASTDFYFGMRLDPRSIVPYDGLMDIAMNEPDHAMGRLLLNRGLKIQPYSFILRVSYKWSLLARRGGSYAAMEEFASQRHMRRRIHASQHSPVTKIGTAVVCS